MAAILSATMAANLQPTANHVSHVPRAGQANSANVRGSYTIMHLVLFLFITGGVNFIISLSPF